MIWTETHKPRLIRARSKALARAWGDLRMDNQALTEAIVDLLHNKRQHHCSGCHIEKAREALAKHAKDLMMVTAEQRRRQDAIERYRAGVE